MAKATTQETSKVPPALAKEVWYEKTLQKAKDDLLPKMYHAVLLPRYTLDNGTLCIQRFIALAKDQREYDVELHIINTDEGIKVQVYQLALVGKMD